MIYEINEHREPVKYELSKEGYNKASERYINDLVKKGNFSSNGLLNSFKVLRKIHKNRLSN